MIDPLAAIESDAPAKLSSDAESKTEVKLYGDALRDEQQKAALHTVFLWFIRVLALCFIVILLVRAVHFILPVSWCWLTEAQIQGIDKSFFTAVMGALVAIYGKQALRPAGD